MGLVQYLALALLLPALLVLTFPAKDWTESDEDLWCEPGYYQKSRTECAPCSPGSYTTERNQEESCHRCFGDCRPDYNLQVEHMCNATSNTKCVCRAGFKCTESYDVVSCRQCEAATTSTTTTSASTTVTSGKNKQAVPLLPGLAGPCHLPNCSSQTDSPTSNNAGTGSSPLAAILSPVVVMACVALVILFCVRRPGDETCFKRAIVKLYNEGGHEASHKSKESTHQFPRDSFSAKQQPSSHSAANLGPVHVHNPGTVIFSLLSQFTGQVGPTVEGKAAAEKTSGKEDEERSCPVFHPTRSPSVHLSEEERSGEVDSIFFPSQEQGKDCHMSKEEEL